MGEVAGAKGSWRDSAEESPLSAGKNNALKITAKTSLCLKRRSNNGKRYVSVKLFLRQSLFRNRRQKKTSGENNEKPTAGGDKKEKQKFHNI